MTRGRGRHARGSEERDSGRRSGTETTRLVLAAAGGAAAAAGAEAFGRGLDAVESQAHALGVAEGPQAADQLVVGQSQVARTTSPGRASTTPSSRSWTSASISDENPGFMW